MFQNVIRDEQAPGVEGDFASTNPFSSILAGPGSLVAPKGGIRVGSFAWVGPNGEVSQSAVAGWQVGYCGRNQQGLITAFLGEDTLMVPEGFMVTLFDEGDFWARFPAGANVGDTVYADPNDGTPLGNTGALGAGTGSAGFSGQGSVAINSTTLTISTATAGIVSPNDAVTTANVPAGTIIVAQLTGTPGGLGTYEMSAEATATSGPQAVTTTSNNLLLTAESAGAFNEGDVITGAGVIAGTQITGQVTPFSGVASTTNASTALVVTAVTPGTDLLRVGAKVVMAGVPAGTTISAQTAGTPGGLGTYTLSANATQTKAGVPITTGDKLGETGLYTISNAQQFASTAVTVAGAAVNTGYKVRGAYSPAAGELGKISTR